VCFFHDFNEKLKITQLKIYIFYYVTFCVIVGLFFGKIVVVKFLFLPK